MNGSGAGMSSFWGRERGMETAGTSVPWGVAGPDPAGACTRCREPQVRGGGGDAGTQELTEEELRQVEELKKRDQEVRAHEQAHVAAGGQYVRGGASYEYQTGPDGRRYAVGGEVSIDTSPVAGDPRATIQKMMIVRKAALAPATPSAQDRSVAATAQQQMNKARQELMREQAGEREAQYSGDSHSLAGVYDGSGAPGEGSGTGAVFDWIV